MARTSGGCDARDMDALIGKNAESIADCTGVDISTARRWKSGASKLPDAARKLLEADPSGLYGAGAQWRGWRIVGNEIISPEGWHFSCGEVLSILLMRQQIATKDAEIRAFRGMEPQPQPDAADASIKRA